MVSIPGVEPITEDLGSGQLTTEKGGKQSLIRNFTVVAESLVAAEAMGPPYGCKYPNKGVYVRVKAAAPVPQKKYLYRLKVTYDSPDAVSNPPIDYVFWSTDIATQTQRIYNIKTTSDRTEYPSGTRFAGRTAINEDDEGNVEGIDILVPKVQITAKVLRKVKYWTDEYQQTVYSLVTKINSKPFKGFEPGEVMFMGCQEEPSGEDYINLTYQFLAEKNTADDMTVNEEAEGTIVSVIKKGWQLLWPRIGKYLVAGIGSEATDKLKTGVLTINVDDVYKQSDFAVLGLTDTDTETSDYS